MALQDLKQAIPAGHRQMLVTEVTRMGDGMVCVAGIDVASGAMIRPLQPDGRNWPEDKWVDAGHIRVGKLLSLSLAAGAASDKPHGTEDVRVARVTGIGAATAAQLFDACVETADDDLTDIVGDNLIDDKYVEERADCRSLGCLIVDGDSVSVSKPFDKIRVSFNDPDGVRHHLSVTELTFDGQDDDALHALRDRLVGHDRVALRIGLARAWRGRNGEYDPRRCYMQLNGVIVPA